MTRLLPVLALALAGCAADPPLPADPAATLDPIAFFAGASAGDGTLRIIFDDPQPIRVESRGRRNSDTLVLDQSIREGDKPARQRRWIMQRTAPGRYTGSLTDASGPVAVAVEGPRATISYRMKNGMAVRQQLALQKGGRVILNRLEVRRFGVRLAVLDETIRKTGPVSARRSR